MLNQCGTCRVCCEGWLYAKVLGQTLSPNNPCKFLNKPDIEFGCSIHKDRPLKPCQIFNCLWITQDMPENFKPSSSGVIAMQNKIENEPYVFLVNAPNYPSEELVNWFINNKKYNNILYFEKNDNLVFLGTDNFIDLINQNKTLIIDEYNKLSMHYIK